MSAVHQSILHDDLPVDRRNLPRTPPSQHNYPTPSDMLSSSHVLGSQTLQIPTVLMPAEPDHLGWIESGNVEKMDGNTGNYGAQTSQQQMEEPIDQPSDGEHHALTDNEHEMLIAETLLDLAEPSRANASTSETPVVMDAAEPPALEDDKPTDVEPTPRSTRGRKRKTATATPTPISDQRTLRRNRVVKPATSDRICENCKEIDTVHWHRYEEVKWLCNPCGIHLKRKKVHRQIVKDDEEDSETVNIDQPPAKIQAV